MEWGWTPRGQYSKWWTIQHWCAPCGCGSPSSVLEMAIGLCSQLTGLHFFLVCSTGQSFLNLLPPTRKPDYFYRRREESRAAPARLPCFLSGMQIAVILVAEGKHIAAADNKPDVASWELCCKQLTFLHKILNLLNPGMPRAQTKQHDQKHGQGS